MKLVVTLQILVADLLDRASSKLKSERGSVTIEQVLWAVALIAIVAIVVTAIRAYVIAQAANIK
jgi:hypothetical protein